MVGRLRLSRSQIARFVGNDPEAIKAIESLFTQDVVNQTTTEEVAIQAATADASANSALSQFQAIADLLELVTSSPRVEQRLSDLADVYAPTVSDGDVVQWDTDRWIAAPSGGGGTALNGTAIVTVPNKRYEWTEIVPALGVVAADIIMATLAPTLDTDQNDPEMLTITSIAGLAATDAIRFTITSPEVMAGPIKINWSAL